MARVLDDLVVKLALLTLPISFALLTLLLVLFHPASRDLAAASPYALLGIQAAAGLLGAIPIFTSRHLPKLWKALAIGGYLALALAGGIFLGFVNFCVAIHCE